MLTREAVQAPDPQLSASLLMVPVAADYHGSLRRVRPGIARGAAGAIVAERVGFFTVGIGDIRLFGVSYITSLLELFLLPSLPVVLDQLLPVLLALLLSLLPGCLLLGLALAIPLVDENVLQHLHLALLDVVLHGLFLISFFPSTILMREWPERHIVLGGVLHSPFLLAHAFSSRVVRVLFQELREEPVRP